MTLTTLKLDVNFFSKVEFRKETLKAIDLDNQFNGIAEFINNEVVPIINQFITGVMPGIFNNANAYLKNVGDGTTTWALINSQNSIEKYSLSLDLFKQTTPGSVIVAGADGILRILTPTEPNTCLISTENTGPIWKKITGLNINDGAITSAKIADKTIEKQNLDSTSLAWLFDTTLTSEKLMKNTIENSCFANEAITFDSLDKKLQNTLFTSYPTISGDKLGNNILKLSTKEHYELLFGKDSFEKPGIVPLKAYHFKDSNDPRTLNVKPFTIYDLSDDAIYGYHIADNSINGARIHGTYQIQIEPGTLDIDCFPVDYKTKLGL